MILVRYLEARAAGIDLSFLFLPLVVAGFAVAVVFASLCVAGHFSDRDQNSGNTKASQ